MFAPSLGLEYPLTLHTQDAVETETAVHDELYVVERWTGKRRTSRNGTREVQIKWQGYKKLTWEPEVTYRARCTHAHVPTTQTPTHQANFPAFSTSSVERSADEASSAGEDEDEMDKGVALGPVLGVVLGRRGFPKV